MWDNIYALLTKGGSRWLENGQVCYFVFCFFFFGPISSHLDQTSLVNKRFIIMAIKNIFLQERTPNQNTCIQFILADCGVSHILKVIYSSVISNRITIISSLSCKHLIYFIYFKTEFSNYYCHINKNRNDKNDLVNEFWHPMLVTLGLPVMA